MNTNTFRVPMFNRLRIGPYDFPYQTNPPTEEWLIASRHSNHSSYLTISDTSTPFEPGSTKAPEGLTEQNTIVAVLAEESDGNLQFLMLRHHPEGVPIPGRFFPAEGAATLKLEDGQIRLNAFGRHAHSTGNANGESILHDIPNPAPNASGAINWHFTAEERPWSIMN